MYNIAILDESGEKATSTIPIFFSESIFLPGVSFVQHNGSSRTGNITTPSLEKQAVNVPSGDSSTRSLKKDGAPEESYCGMNRTKPFYLQILRIF